MSHDLATNLRRLKADSGKTWTEIAQAIGKSERLVHKWASGKVMPNEESQRLLRVFFDVERHEL